MNGREIKSNKATHKLNGYTHINLPIFSDNSVSKIGCMEDVDIGVISKFGIQYTGYNPNTESISDWPTFVQKVNDMFDYLNDRINQLGSDIVSIEWKNYSVTPTSVTTGGTVTLTPGIIRVTTKNGSTSDISVTREHITVSNGTLGTTASNGNISITAGTAGTMTIYAKYQGLTASQTVSVSVTNPSYTLTITPNSGTLSITNQTITLTATTTVPGNPSFTWSIDSGSGGSISSTNNSTATIQWGTPASTSSLRIKCQATNGSATASGTATITCNAKPTPQVSISQSPTGNLTSTNSPMSLTANPSNLSNVSYKWEITSGDGATLSATSNQTVTLIHNNTSTSNKTVTVKCTVTGSEGSANNTINITVEGQVTKYKYAVVLFTMDQSLDLNYMRTTITNAWNSSTTYWTEKPNSVNLPAPNSNFFTYTIVYDEKLGQGKLRGMDNETLNSGSMGGSDWPVPDGCLGMYCNYGTSTTKYLAGSSKDARIEWK